ncbi:serine/threonine-protein kinase [Nonomuraea sp. NPDC050328]|uniref:serine/threonine-protein kinase n=1 Tax=Nonomuraea sp. NPDC050328 TaxID=3364361 RepID=UPI0037A39928
MSEQHKGVAGRVLAGRYELLAPLGRGTMGTVWRAHDRTLGREVAIKEIRQDSGLSEAQRAELRERMVREGRTASRINHPSVAAIYDVLIHDDSPWIIMELVEARSLEQVIEEEGPLPPRLVAEIGVDLLGALRAAHAQGITHRDVKPGNVLITEHGRVVLTDFGIAKAEGDTKLTKTGMVIGSPGYTAPERARGEYTGPESDVWSLGATLYFAVEGRPAYERSSIAETLAALMTESADPPTQAGPLRPVLDGMLNKIHQQRLSTAKAETMLRMVADTPTHEFPAVEEPIRVQSAESWQVPQPTSDAWPRPQQNPWQNHQPPAAPPAQQPAQQQGHPPVQHPGHPPVQQPGQPPVEVPGWSGGFDPDQDPNRTVTVARPKHPLNQPPGPGHAPGTPGPGHAPGPQGPPPGYEPQPPSFGGPLQPADPRPPVYDESSETTRVVQPHPPGQQVYPSPPQNHQQGHQQNPWQSHQPPPAAPMPPERGLGTDLFAIAGQSEAPRKASRTGMFILMAIAAAAAVIIAILVLTG